jgi:hypothetical protein
VFITYKSHVRERFMLAPLHKRILIFDQLTRWLERTGASASRNVSAGV